jgi:membrane-bound metal-dependent hydrolase YbcI (DUF457 family)
VYLGHVGIALAAKGIRRDVALVVLLVATYGPDWIDAALCVGGVYDRRGMLSHSFPAAVVLAIVVFAGYRLWKGETKSALVVVVVVLSHIVLDWITGYKPTWPGGPMIGLLLYEHPIMDLILESLLIAAGVYAYRRSLPVRSQQWIYVSLMLGMLVLMQAALTIARALTVSLPKC